MLKLNIVGTRQFESKIRVMLKFYYRFSASSIVSGRFLSDVCGPNNTNTAAIIADPPRRRKGNDG